jgi:hypothetical protein
MERIWILGRVEIVKMCVGRWEVKRICSHEKTEKTTKTLRTVSNLNEKGDIR